MTRFGFLALIAAVVVTNADQVVATYVVEPTEKDVITNAAEAYEEQHMVDREQGTAGDGVSIGTSSLLARDSLATATAPPTCLSKTVSFRQGPVYVGFELPTSEAGTQFTFRAGRAYRHLGDTCHIVGWSDSVFECNGESQDFVQVRGNWLVSLEIPQDCVNGGGSVQNQVQSGLVVSTNLPLTCPGASIDVHESPVHLQFSLPAGRSAFSNVFFEGGSIGRKVNGQCHQIEWTNMMFTCDPEFYEWRVSSGLWRSPQQPIGCDSWPEGVTQVSNAEQEFLQAVDSTGLPSCQAAQSVHESGPLSVAFQLPGDFSRGSSLSFRSGQAVRWFNNTCHNLLWTDHEWLCDIYTDKWILETGDFVSSPTDPRYCNGLTGGFIVNGNQPFLQVFDQTQTSAPTMAPFQIIRPILTQAPSWQPTFTPNVILRPIETGVPQAPTGIPVPGWPTRAPHTVVKPLEPSVPHPTKDPVGAIYATITPMTPRPTSNPTRTPPVTLAPVNYPTTSSPSRLPTTAMPTNPSSSWATPGPTRTVTNGPTTVVPAGTATDTAQTDAFYCDCPACTSAIWDSDADSFSCGQRITYIVNLGSSLSDACRQVAANEFPGICGFCNPDQCGPVNNGNSGQDSTTLPPTQTRVTEQPTDGSYTFDTGPGQPTDPLPQQTGSSGLNAKPGISASLASQRTQFPSEAPSTRLVSSSDTNIPVAQAVSAASPTSLMLLQGVCLSVLLSGYLEIMF